MTRVAPIKSLTNTILGSVALVAVIASVWFFGFVLPNADQVQLTGLVQAKEVKNASRFGGRVLKILVHEGDAVKVGQPLVTFDDVDLKAKIADAQAALTEATARQQMLMAGATSADLRQGQAKLLQAQENLRMLRNGARPEQQAQSDAQVIAAQSKLDAARQAYQQSTPMLNEGVISRQKYEELKVAYDAANSNYESAKAASDLAKKGGRPEEINIAQTQVSAAAAQYSQLRGGARPQELQIAAAAVSQAQAALDALKSQLSELSLKAPISGVVSIISVSEGELVQAGRPVVSVIDPNDLWTDVYLSESKLSKVQEGQPVKVTPLVTKNVAFNGHVTYVSPKSEFVPGSDGAASGEEAVFKLKIALDPLDANKENHLRPGMNVRVAFQR